MILVPLVFKKQTKYDGSVRHSQRICEGMSLKHELTISQKRQVNSENQGLYTVHLQTFPPSPRQDQNATAEWKSNSSFSVLLREMLVMNGPLYRSEDHSPPSPADPSQAPAHLPTLG